MLPSVQLHLCFYRGTQFDITLEKQKGDCIPLRKTVRFLAISAQFHRQLLAHNHRSVFELSPNLQTEPCVDWWTPVREKDSGDTHVGWQLASSLLGNVEELLKNISKWTPQALTESPS